MADANRTTVDKLVLHHAVTPLWPEKTKAQLAQWFSDNGYARAYGSNPANWSGLINPYTGGRSYSQAHFAGQTVDNSTPDASNEERAAGYRLVPLVADVWGQITWHAGNWAVNQSSIGIENLGDFRNYTLSDGAQKVIAAFWRPRDLALNGNTAVYGHQEIYATACPARIMEVRDRIVNYINNPPVIVPPIPTTPTWVAMSDPRKMIANQDLYAIDLVTGQNVGAVITAGTPIDFNNKTTWNGKDWLRTVYSSSKGLNVGIEQSKLAEVPVVSTNEEIVIQTIPYTTEKIDDPTISLGQSQVTQIGVAGERTIVYTVTYTNGVETSRVVKSDSTTKEPINEIIKVGSKTEPDVPVAPLPEPNEPASSWLAKVWAWIKEILKSFTYKG